MALDLLGCTHTHLQGYTEMYKNRSTVKEVGGQWGIGQKERLPIEEGGNRLSAWQSPLMTSINELVLLGRSVCRFILLSSGALLSRRGRILHLFSPCSVAAQ